MARRRYPAVYTLADALASGLNRMASRIAQAATLGQDQWAMLRRLFPNAWGSSIGAMQRWVNASIAAADALTGMANAPVRGTLRAPGALVPIDPSVPGMPRYRITYALNYPDVLGRPEGELGSDAFSVRHETFVESISDIEELRQTLLRRAIAKAKRRETETPRREGWEEDMPWIAIYHIERSQLR